MCRMLTESMVGVCNLGPRCYLYLPLDLAAGAHSCFLQTPKGLFTRVTSPARSFLFQRHLLLVKFRKLIETCSFSQSSALWVPTACLRKTDQLLIPPQPDVVVQEQVFHPLLLVPSVRQGGSRMLQLLQVCRHTYGLTPSEQTMELTFCRRQMAWPSLLLPSCPVIFLTEDSQVGAGNDSSLVNPE